MPKFTSQGDLESECGGSAQLKQWLDKNQDGVADAPLVAKALDAGEADVLPYVEVCWDLDTIAAPFPVALVLNCARAAAYHAARIGADGQSVPPEISRARDEAVLWAKDVAEKRATLGLKADVPVLSPQPEVVDPDPRGRRVSMRGLKRGFR